VANPLWVNASYVVAAAYVVGDVAYHGYKAKEAGKSTTVRARMRALLLSSRPPAAAAVHVACADLLFLV
jgi:hypothetical protein